MTDTQKHALVLYDLGYVTLNTQYYTSALYSIYLSHQAQVDAIFSNPTQLDSILQTNQQYLGQIIIMDPDAVWG